MRIPALALFFCLLSACKAALPKGEAAPLLAQGKEHFTKKKYRDAARYFRSVLKRHSEADEAEEASFLHAESHRHLQNGQQSFTAFKAFVDRYHNSRFAVGAAVGEYRLGMDYLEGRIPGFLFFGPDPGLGVPILEHMQIHFRNHSLADDALVKVADFHLLNGDHEEATDVLRRLLSLYPRSPYTLRARYQLARALWLQSEGPDYDERVLLQSRRGFEDFIGTARRLGREKQVASRIRSAQKMIGTINGALARKQYRIGRFYERTGHAESAAYYYRYCMEEYPGTKYAGESQRRLDGLEG